MWFGGSSGGGPAQSPTNNQSNGDANRQVSTSSSSDSNPATNSQQSQKISFYLKSGIFIKRITVDTDKMALGLIKQLAINFINEIYFNSQIYPEKTFIGDYIKQNFSSNDNIQTMIYDRLVLRKYVMSATNSSSTTSDSFIPFNSVCDIEQDSYICIEVSEKLPTQNTSTHLLPQSQTKSSSNASHNQSNSTANNGSSTTNQSINQSNNNNRQRCHEFKTESFLLPAYCSNCSAFLKGVFRQGFQCHHCKRNFCSKCKQKAETLAEACSNVSPTNANQSSSSQSNLQSPPALLSPTSENVPTSSDDTTSGANNNKSASIGNQHANMSKRKSASNLLHFNLVFPFKHSHGQSSGAPSPATSTGTNQNFSSITKQYDTHESSKKTSKGSTTGGLDSVLQQFGKMRTAEQNELRKQQEHAKEHQQQQQEQTQQQNNLMVTQANHLSSSHQNLYLNERDIESSSRIPNSSYADETLVGSSSARQSPVTFGGPIKNAGRDSQLSNSARTSAHDIHEVLSPSKRSNHAFVELKLSELTLDTLCDVCKKVLSRSGSISNQQGGQSVSCAVCRSCKLHVHAHCQRLALTDCLSRIAESSRQQTNNEPSANKSTDSGTGGSSVLGESNNNEVSAESRGQQVLKKTNSSICRDNSQLRRLNPSVKHKKPINLTKAIIEGWLKHKTLSDEQARKHYWRLDETDITLYEDKTSPRYFKAIALNKITRVMSAKSLPKLVKEDVLMGNLVINGGVAYDNNTTTCSSEQTDSSKSAQTSPVRGSPQLKQQMSSMFAFETTSGSMYLVQADTESEAHRWMEQLTAITLGTKEKNQQQASSEGSHVLEQTRKLKDCSEIVEKVTKTEEVKKEDNKQVKTSSQDRQQTSEQKNERLDTCSPAKTVQAIQPKMQRQHHHRYPPSSQTQHAIYTDPNRSRLYNRPRITIKIDSFYIPDHLIEGKYLIERDRLGEGTGFAELGSGQFGKVYAGISELKSVDAKKGLWSGVPVAIKEICKERFDLQQQAKLKNEATILSRLDHPGVIILERVHDTFKKIYIVMEQLEDDMLEMITSAPEKRLNERVTKFLIYQILEALKYLHAQNIAHCDLKPENVLIVERRSQFPQIKLCDFGFAKIIEDNSFRKSLIGTPAYLAPEVFKGERYNRSVDLWSVGVIVYVSLSGEFPFNEGDQNIQAQILEADYMYPEHPWKDISAQAKKFINSLLRVNSEKRLSANRAQMDHWLQDFQLWCDLIELEVRVGKRWVTDDADFERWSRYAKEHNLQIPRSAYQLHDELLAD